MKNVHELGGVEEGTAFYSVTGLPDDYEDDFRRVVICGASLIEVWNPDIALKNVARGKGIDCDFSIIWIHSLMFVLLSERAAEFPLVSKYLLPFGEVYPVQLFERRMILFYCRRKIDSYRKNARAQISFFESKLPSDGIFGALESSRTFLVDSGAGGFVSGFYSEGHMGLRFDKCDVLDDGE